MKKKEYVLPPSVLFPLFLIGCFGLMYDMMVRGIVTSVMARTDPRLLLVCCIGMTIKLSEYHRITSDGITGRILCFKTNQIRWRFTQQVLLYDEAPKPFADDPKLIIVCDGCKPYDPERDTVKAYMKRYKEILTIIPIPRKQKESCKAAVEEFYGPILEVR